MNGIGILGTGSYLPKQEVTNDDIAELVTGADAAWISRRTMIECRRWAAPTEATSDLAAQAGLAALQASGLKADQITHLIVSTSTPDSPQPPTACLVQQEIGATRAACLDINVVCAGFVYGLALARSLVCTDPLARVLVIAADLYSRILDLTDRRTAVLLGDGAGAAVVGPVPDGRGIIEADLASYGHAKDLIHVAGGGSRLPTSAGTLANGDHFFRMDGRGVRDFVMDGVPGAIDGLLSRAGIAKDEVRHLVPHQANGMLLTELVERCGLTGATTHRTLERYGNVGSASVAITLDDAVRRGALADDDLVVLAAFGGGMSVGTMALRWSA